MTGLGFMGNWCEMTHADDVDCFYTRGHVMFGQNVAPQEIDDRVANVLRHNDLDTDVRVIVVNATGHDVPSTSPGTGDHGIAGGSAVDERIQQPEF